MPDQTPISPRHHRVVVTGGFGALGMVVGSAFLAAGHQVALVGHTAARREEIHVRSDRCLPLSGVDLTDEIAVTRALSEVANHFGGLDVLVNVAGAFHWEKLEGSTNDSWRSLFEANVISAVTASRAALMYLGEGGRIVNVGAAAAERPGAGFGPYAAAKAGLAAFTKSLALELAARKITVNAVLPSIIDTPQNRLAMPDADASEWVSPAAIADVIVYLASGKASAISGALIPVTQS
jgi:NAD(P)-dependent dehydrogenase (short-subunit alcohol dehydrogenase family)